MIRHQDDSKSVLVAIEAAEPLENGLGVPRLLGSVLHAASLVTRDCHLGCIRTKYTPAAHRRTTPFSRAYGSVELPPDQLLYGPVVRRVELSRLGTPRPMETRMKHTDATVPLTCRSPGRRGASASRGFRPRLLPSRNEGGRG
jgi:hypothetical protein